MDQTDLRAFHRCMFVLSHCLPVPVVNLEVVTEYYFADLAHYPWAAVEPGFVYARRTCRYFPTIAELLEIVEAIDKPRRLAARRAAAAAAQAQEVAAFRTAEMLCTPPAAAGAALVGALAAQMTAPPLPPAPTAEEQAARKEVLREQYRHLLLHQQDPAPAPPAQGDTHE